MQKNNIKTSLATIYNTLHSLCDAGLLKDLRFPHMDKVIYDNNTEAHYHFLNEESGELVDVPIEDFPLNNEISQKFDISSVDILIRGKSKKQ